MKNEVYFASYDLNLAYKLAQRPMLSKLAIPRLLGEHISPECAEVLSYSVFLGQVTSKLYIGVDLRLHVDLAERYLQQTFFLAGFYAERQKQQVATYTLQAFPVHASVTSGPVSVLYVVNQINAGGKMLFQTLIYCDGSFRTLDATVWPQRVYALLSYEKKVSEVKNKFKVIGQNHAFAARFLVLNGGYSAKVYEVDFSRYEFAENQTKDDEVIKFVNKRFGKQFVDCVEPFGEITGLKLCFTPTDLVEGQPCFMTYNASSRKLVFVSQSGSDAHIQFTSLKMLEDCSFSTHQNFTVKVPINVGRILCFSDLLLKPGHLKIEYYELSNMNSLLCFQSIEIDKVVLICVHLQNGSIIKLSDQFAYGNTRVSKGEYLLQRSTNHTSHAYMMADYLINYHYINSEQRDSHIEYYDRVFSLDNLEHIQPHIVPFSFGIVWMTPNFKKNVQNQQIVKVLPFCPLEKIYHSWTSFGYQRIGQLFREDNLVQRTFYDYCFADYPFSDLTYYTFNYEEIAYMQQRIYNDMQELQTRIQPNNFSDSTQLSSTQDILQNSLYTDHQFESFDSDLSSNASDYYHINVIDVQSGNQIMLFTALFGAHNLCFQYQGVTVSPVIGRVDTDAETIDFFRIVQDEVLKLKGQDVGELSSYVVSNALFSRSFMDKYCRCLSSMTVKPNSLLIKLGSKAENPSFQIQYSQLLRYYQEIAQHLPASYSIQFGEIVNILQLIFGDEVQIIMGSFYQSHDVYALLSYLIIALLSKFSAREEVFIEPVVLYNILSLAETIDYDMQHIDSATNRVTVQGLDRILAKFYSDWNNNFNLCKIPHKVQYLHIFDASSHAPTGNEVLIQKLVEGMISNDTYLRELMAKKAIGPEVASAFSQLDFNPYFNCDGRYAKERGSHIKAHYFIGQIALAHSEINQKIQSYTNHKQVFLAFISDNNFTGQLLTVASLFEQILTRQIYSDLANNNENFIVSADCVFPYWLAQQIYCFAGFNPDVQMQCDFLYTNYSDVPSDADYRTFYKRALTISPLEFQLFANVTVASALEKKRSKLVNYFSPRPHEQAFIAKMQIEEKAKQSDIFEQLVLISELEIVNYNYALKDDQYVYMYEKACSGLKLPYKNRVLRKQTYSPILLGRSFYLKQKLFDYVMNKFHSERRYSEPSKMWAAEPWLETVLGCADPFIYEFIGHYSIKEMVNYLLNNEVEPPTGMLHE